jgi:hypothetical protein
MNIQVTESNINYLLGLVEENPKRFEFGRVLKAINLSKEKEILELKIKQYETTIFRCSCMDSACRGVKCKHMIAVMIKTGLFA